MTPVTGLRTPAGSAAQHRPPPARVIALAQLALGHALPQRRLVFGRPRILRPVPAGPHADELEREMVTLPVGRRAELRGWIARPAPGIPLQGALLYFPGRNEHVAWAPAIASYARGWAVYAFAYRGLSGSTGRPGEREAVADAVAIHDFVRTREGPALPRIAVMGRSLGTGVAIQLATRVATDRLVLVSPYDAMEELVRLKPLFRHLGGALHHRFESIRHAPAVHCPTLVLLSEHDELVPHARSLKLGRAIAGPTRFHLVRGTTHQSLVRSRPGLERVGAFLEAGVVRRGEGAAR